MATPDDTVTASDVELGPTELAARAATPAGSFYEFIDAQQVTQFVPPNSSRLVWQIRSREPNTGIVFLQLVNDHAFRSANYVRTHGNRIGHILYDEAQVPGVAGISVRQVTDDQQQLVNELDVTVQSSSGNSAGRITVPYPNPADRAGSIARFTKLVEAEVQLLDANEAS